jgi:hypothetical protein
MRHLTIPPADLAVVRGLRCSTAVRTALDIARSEPLVAAVVALDVMLARVIVGRSGLEVPQYTVFDSRGDFVARLDLAFPSIVWRPSTTVPGTHNRASPPRITAG